MDTLSEGEIGMLNETAKLQNRIIAAAVALFRKLGYEKTTVNDICREADIARSTFYLNFAGKKEIIGKILSDASHEDVVFSGSLEGHGVDKP